MKKRRKKSRIREYAEYFALRFLLFLSGLLPEVLLRALFRGLFRLFFLLGRRRRRLTLENLAIAFPEWSKKERRRTALRSYLHLAECFCFNLRVESGRVSNEELLRSVKVEGWEHFEALDPDRGVLVITGHVGNWELLPQYAALRIRRPLHVIARRGNNRLVEERIVRPLRERFGVTVFYKRNAVMRIVKAVARGEICGLLIDQKLNPPAGIFVPFFGRPAPTTPSSAVLQIRFGVPVLPAFMLRTGPCAFRLVVLPAVEWEEDGRPFEEQVADLTRRHQAVIEEIIRRYPEQWFWMHNRWKLPEGKRKERKK